jgi:hypothetical protein
MTLLVRFTHNNAVLSAVMLLAVRMAVGSDQCPAKLEARCYPHPSHYKKIDQTASPTACCSLCSADGVKCGSFSFYENNGTCLLKPGPPTKKTKDTQSCNTTSGTMPSGPSPPPAPPSPAPGPSPTAALNVLMFAVDDLRPLGTAFGEPGALMPNLDLLAANSTIFTNAYAQASTCGVSRSSLLTSRRPDTTRNFCSGDYNTVCPFATDAAHTDWVSGTLLQGVQI